MADNSIPTSYDPIVQLLEDAADGAHTHGAAIGLVHNDEAHIRADLIALVGKPAGPGGVPPAVPGFKSLWNVAQTNKSTKTAALRTARARLSGLRDELSQLIKDDDDRWYAFGFDKPSDPSTPEVPANLVATAGAAGSKTVIADWDDARRADSYRFRAVTKADNKEVANEIVSDSQISFVLAKAAAGAVVVLTVTGRNSAGESPASDPVEFTVP